MKFILKGKPKKGEVKLVFVPNHYGDIIVNAIGPDSSDLLITFSEKGYLVRFKGNNKRSADLGFLLNNWGQIKEWEEIEKEELK
jgi:hypothetical protein